MGRIEPNLTQKYQPPYFIFMLTPSRIQGVRLFVFAALLISFQTLFCFGQEQLPMKNPGFEEGTKDWVASPEDTAGQLSQVVPEAAHTGEAGLRVKQEAEGPGSWFQSSKTPLQPGTAYTLRFWARCIEDSGIGIWVQYFDAQGKNIKTPAAVMIQIPQNAREWKECSLDIKSPEGAQSVTVAIHCYSKRKCFADIDDITISPSTSVTTAAPAAPVKAESTIPAPDPARIKEIAAMLDAKPHGIGPSLDDRKVWDALGADVDFREKMIARATRFLTEPIPVCTQEAYEASAKTGDRKDGVAVDRRRFRMVTFVLAEGMENQGRFLPAIDKEINAICTEHTWIMSGHAKFTRGNDLGTAMTSWNLATAVTMLGDKLPEATRTLVRDEVRKRVLTPFLDQVHGVAKSDFWRDNGANWNAVVHAGITGAALALEEDVQVRAEIVAASETETQFYIRGFPADGYSYEGMGYWKYGFGHYVMLSEVVMAATHGKINLYAKESIPQLAQFPRRFEVASGIYPAYSDAQFLEQPSLWLYNIIDHRYGLGDKSVRTMSVDAVFSAFLYAWGINLAFDVSAPPVYEQKDVAIVGHRLRDWFEQSQVLVGRMPAGKDGLNFSFKGGNNGTSHNHNDLGTFLVTVGSQPMVVDPGVTVYGATTFGPKRFENQIIGSYGHSVPRVAGQLQKTGEKYCASLVEKKFSDEADSVTLDLTKGYEVPTLRKLTRRFDYSRANKGSVTVTDQIDFTTPQAFGTALSTYGEAQEEKAGVWIISQGGQKLRVEIQAGGAAFTVTNEMLKDEARAGKVRSLGIALNAPTAQGTITIKMTPVL